MSTKNSFWSFVFGGMVGAAVALLYAPHSGEKTRRMLIDNGQVFKDKAMDTLQEAQARMGTLTEESKKRLEQLQEIGQHTLEEQKESLRTGFKQAREVVAGDGTPGSSGEMYE